MNTLKVLSPILACREHSMKSYNYWIEKSISSSSFFIFLLNKMLIVIKWYSVKIPGGKFYLDTVSCWIFAWKHKIPLMRSWFFSSIPWSQAIPTHKQVPSPGQGTKGNGEADCLECSLLDLPTLPSFRLPEALLEELFCLHLVSRRLPQVPRTLWLWCSHFPAGCMTPGLCWPTGVAVE